MDESLLPELEEDEFYVKDLLGLKVYNQQDVLLGEIKNIDDFGSADVYTIKLKGKETLFAFVEGLFDSVDYENKKIIINDKLFEEVMVWK